MTNAANDAGIAQSTALGFASVVMRAEDLLTRRTSCSVVMLGSTGTPLILRDHALQVWDATAEPVVIGAVSDALAALYGVPSDRVRADILAFVCDLLAEGVLVERQSTGDHLDHG